MTNSKKILDKVSLVIVTHERPKLLRRAFEYYNKFFNNLIIVDSSKKKIKYYKKKSYLHLPDKSFLEKIYIGISKSKTKYILIASDDDFILPQSVCEGLKFIENKKDYISAGGEFFSIENYRSFFKYKKMYSSHYHSYENENILNRVKKISQSHPQMVYYLYNKKLILKFIKKFIKIKYVNFGEIVLTFLPTLYGKHKHLDCTWMLRDGLVHTNYKVANLKQNDNKNQILEFDGNFKNNPTIKYFIGVISTILLKKKNHIDKIMLNNIFNLYFTRYFTKKNIENFNLKKYLFKKINFLFFGLKFFYYFYFNLIKNKNFKQNKLDSIKTIEAIILKHQIK